MSTPQKSKYFEPLAIGVARGLKINTASEAAGCSKDWAYELSRHAEFKLRVAELRSAALQEAVGKLSQEASNAVQTLADGLSKDKMTAEQINQFSKVRLPAAKALLASLLPLNEQLEMRQRIDALEAKQQPRVMEQAG